jgi:hypothetical protein
MEVNDQLHTFATLFSGKQLPVSIGQEAGWTLDPAGNCGEENISLARQELNPDS